MVGADYPDLGYPFRLMLALTYARHKLIKIHNFFSFTILLCSVLSLEMRKHHLIQQ